MGLFGGGNSTTNNTTKTNTSTNYNTGSGASSNTSLSDLENTGTIRLTTTDYGAIQGGLALGNAALQSNQSALSQAIGQSQAVVDKTLGIAQQNQTSQSSQFQSTLIKLFAIVGGVIAVVYINKKG